MADEYPVQFGENGAVLNGPGMTEERQRAYAGLESGLTQPSASYSPWVLVVTITALMCSTEILDRLDLPVSGFAEFLIYIGVGAAIGLLQYVWMTRKARGK